MSSFRILNAKIPKVVDRLKNKQVSPKMGRPPKVVDLPKNGGVEILRKIKALITQPKIGLSDTSIGSKIRESVQK